MSLPSLLLVGCGKMGGALWQGWLDQGVAPSVILDRSCAAPPAPHRLARVASEIPTDFRPDIIILAVKPAGMEEALASLRPFLDGTIIISMLAARTIDSLSAACGGASTKIVRAMPNTPAAIGRGVTGVVSNDLDEAGRALCTTLLSAVGDVAWVDSETQLEALTPISGCGPAYVFLLAELLEKEALRVGLPPRNGTTHRTRHGLGRRRPDCGIGRGKRDPAQKCHEPQRRHRQGAQRADGAAGLARSHDESRRSGHGTRERDGFLTGKPGL